MRTAGVAVALALVAAAGLAGCSGSGKTSSSTGTFGLSAEATETTGVILGVVVDQSIQPLKGASVALHLPDGGARNASSDQEGRFVFDGLQPGTYFLAAKKLNYQSSQTSVEVKAGVKDPPVVRMQLAALFSQQPYSVFTKFNGHIECGYVLIILSSLCVNDYTTLVVNGGVAPQLRTLVDNRGYISGVDRGWQTLIFELQWTPSAQGTSDQMFVLVSYVNRTASDYFATLGGSTPVLLRLEVNETGVGQGGDPKLIDWQGRPDLYTFAGIDGDTVAFGIEQDFSIYESQFYFGKPPEGWSFLAGDAPPF